MSGTGQSPPAGEGRLERVGWRVLGASDRVVGVRVATRPDPGAPALTRLPARWSTTAPRVRVCRLGLRLELDLRDNLERKDRVLDRAGVDGEVRGLLGRLGCEPTGRVLAVANEVYRPAATTRPPAASTG